MNWLNKKFPPDTRYHSAIVKGENILTKDGIKVMALRTSSKDLYNRMMSGCLGYHEQGVQCHGGDRREERHLEGRVSDGGHWCDVRGYQRDCLCLELDQPQSLSKLYRDLYRDEHPARSVTKRHGDGGFYQQSEPE